MLIINHWLLKVFIEMVTVLGEPEIECTSDSILVNFNTEDAFEGHVYVKGHYDEAGCRTDATLSRQASITVPFSACGVRRERSVRLSEKPQNNFL